MSAQWLKPLQWQEPGQEVAHALITFHSAEAANKVLTEGIIICRKWVYAEKCKKEPIRCLRCHSWNHLTYTCPQKYDTWGTCGERHNTIAPDVTASPATQMTMQVGTRSALPSHANAQSWTISSQKMRCHTSPPTNHGPTLPNQQK